LIEAMIVVGIIAIMMTLSVTNLIGFQDRSRVNNTAKELISYFRRMQSNARFGERGPDNPNYGCNQSTDKIAAGGYRLKAWATTFGGSNQTNAGPNISSHAVCTDASGDLTTEVEGENVIFTIPRDMVLKHPGAAKMTFEPIFGNTHTGDLSDTDTGKRNQAFVLSLDGHHYRFDLIYGAFTDGCFCTPGSSDVNPNQLPGCDYNVPGSDPCSILTAR
jgi:type II secretory pathway pseudopilin PulG